MKDALSTPGKTITTIAKGKCPIIRKKHAFIYAPESQGSMIAAPCAVRCPTQE
jgi:hypothetical protein